MNTEKLKRYFLLALIAITAIVLASVFIRACRKLVKETKTERVENKQVIENTKKSDSLEAVVTTLQRERMIKDVKDSLSRVAYNRLISYWKNKALTSRAKVDTIIQSNPALKEFVGDQDSLITVIEARNASLETEKSLQRSDFNRLLSITEEQLKLQQETSAILADQRDRYKNKADKRFSVGPFVGVDYQLKPTIGVGITYRVFRF